MNKKIKTTSQKMLFLWWDFCTGTKVAKAS